MPLIPFDPKLHLKVRYLGNRYLRFKGKLFVVQLNDHDFENIRQDQLVIMHTIDQYGIVNYNPSDTSRSIFHARKSDLVVVPADVKI